MTSYFKNFQTFEAEKKLGIFLFIVGIIFLIFFSYVSFTKLGIIYDEVWSVMLIQKPMPEMMSIIQNDVHPPLYYFIFKFVFKIANMTNVSNDAVLIGTFVTILPLYLMFILCLTRIRKQFGWLAAGIFSVSIVTMPSIGPYFSILRMYSLSVFLITFSFLCIYDIMKNDGDIYNWIILTVLTICSTYTHYFSALMSFLLYCFLLIYIILRNRYLIKKFIISTCLCIIAYVPWLFIFLKQAMGIKDNGFPVAASVDLNLFIDSVKFVFSQSNESQVLMFLLLLSFIVLIVSFIKSRNNDFNSKFAIYGISLLFVLFFTSIFISLTVFPIFIPRYLLSALGIFWLGFSILLAKSYDKKKIFVPILIIFLVVATVGCIQFDNYKSSIVRTDEITIDFYNSSVEPGSVVITNTYPYPSYPYGLFYNEFFIKNSTILVVDNLDLFENNQTFSKFITDNNLENQSLYVFTGNSPVSDKYTFKSFAPNNDKISLLHPDYKVYKVLINIGKE